MFRIVQPAACEIETNEFCQLIKFLLTGEVLVLDKSEKKCEV